MKNLKIGKITFKNRLFLAPMLDITNLPYREICRKAGCAMAYTEMINVPAIFHENKKTKDMMKSSKEDSPLGIQITGNNVQEFKKVIPFLKKYDLVDINCGCPSERIYENESGSYLLNEPEKIAEIIKLLKKAGLTVTAKIRLGFKKNNVIQVAKLIEKAGADAITIHARLASQGYDIPADWEWIKKVKKAVSIPVIGNGDVLDEEKAVEMLKICDGVMIARGAIGDPLIFERILYYLKTGKKKPFDFKKNIKCFQDYLKLCEKHKVVNTPIIKHLGCKFIKNIPGASVMRFNLMKCEDFPAIENFFKTIKH